MDLFISFLFYRHNRGLFFRSTGVIWYFYTLVEGTTLGDETPLSGLDRVGEHSNALQRKDTVNVSFLL